MAKLVVIVDDEPDICELVEIHLKKSGYLSKSFHSGKELFKYLEKESPDILILDLMLPDIDGYDICKILRNDNSYKHLPIIMLTAKGDELDKVLGLELGADDYVTKPFSNKELMSRVKALLRRNALTDKTDVIDNIVINEDFIINIGKFEVVIKGVKIDLTTTEFKILRFLAKKRGWVYSREKILDYLWGDEKYVIDRTVDVHIKHLREKLGDYGNLIKNIRGVGYKLVE